MEQEQQNAVDIARLDERVGGLNEKVDTILTNHLPHIQKSIGNLEDKHDKTNEKLSFWGGALAVISFLIPIILFIIGKIWK